jgi:hypothetical protein
MGQGRHFLGVRPRRQREGKACRFLQRQVARRPRVGVAEAGQEIDVGRPRPDAVDGRKGCVRVLGGERGKRGERQFAAIDGAGDRLQGADFRRRKPEPCQPRRADAQDGCRIERVKSRREPPPDGIGAGGRKLLRHNDRGKAGEAVGPAAQRRSSGRGDERDESRIGRAKRGESSVEFGFSVDAGVRHWFGLRLDHGKGERRAYLSTR